MAQVLHAQAALAVHETDVNDARGDYTALARARARAHNETAGGSGGSSAAAPWDKAIAVLSTGCFPTYGSDRRLLLNLWLRAVAQRERATNAAIVPAGRPLTRLELRKLKIEMGCAGDSGTMFTPSGDPTRQACNDGPPNLGYAYGGANGGSTL
jgi:hypothetical protein